MSNLVKQNKGEIAHLNNLKKYLYIASIHTYLHTNFVEEECQCPFVIIIFLFLSLSCIWFWQLVIFSSMNVYTFTSLSSIL